MNAPLDRRTTTNMTSKGQVLIPKDVREAIGLIPGAPVDVGINDRGEAVIVPINPWPGETATERVARLLAVVKAGRRQPLFTEPTDAIMRDLRGDDPLP